MDLKIKILKHLHKLLQVEGNSSDDLAHSINY